MTLKGQGQTLLENAYKLETPEDGKIHCDEFAETHDRDFARASGWEYPNAMASIYRGKAGPSDLPIADIVCGTGPVAEALAPDPQFIDGIDISEGILVAAPAARAAG